MTALNLAYDLANYTPADANPPQNNFQRVEQHVNQEVVNRDGTVAMTGQLKLVGNPISALDAVCKQFVDQLLPIGVCLPFGGPSVPGLGTWKIANGERLSKVDYPEAFSVFGHLYGGVVTDGDFPLPNFVDRVPVGASAERPLGSSGGSAAASLLNHAHRFDHGHGASADNRSTDHAHMIDGHVHTGTSDDGGWHDHGWSQSAFIYNGPMGASRMIDDGGGGLRGATWTPAANHKHTFTTNTNWNGAGTNTGWQSQTRAEWGAAGHQHVHVITVNGTGAINTWGPNEANISAANSANYPPYVSINYIVRVK
jgi:microcystin-dependent protein